MSEEFIDDIIGSSEPAKSEADVLEMMKEPASEKAPEKADVKMEGEARPDVEASPEASKGNDLPGVKELAEKLGWREDHVGEDAVDAATYILRSKDIQKSMSQHNKDLKEQLQTLNGSVEALKVHNEQVYKAEVKKLESEIAALKKERRAAIELADVDKVDELDNQIEAIQKDINAPKVAEKVTQKTDNPAFDEWIKDNDWYLKDDEMAKFADTVSQQYVGAPLDRIYKIVRTKVQEVFPEKFDSPKAVAEPAKSPVGPKSPVERSSAKRSDVTFTKADLTPDQLQIMNQFVRGGIMTEEAYINDIAKSQA